MKQLPPTPYHIFIRLLYAAQHGSDAVDNFDVDSDNPESKREFEALIKAQNKGFQDLIEHISDNREEILQDVRS